MTFAVPGREPLSISLEEWVPPPDSVFGCRREPNEAPFGRTWPKPVLDALAALWGYQVYVQALMDEHYYIEKAARRVLPEIGRGVVPALVQALGDEEWLVRGSVAEALGEMGPEVKEAIPALIRALTQALRDEDWEMSVAGEIALIFITGQDFGPDATRWKQWWKEQQ